jgi:hypothetical protein
MLSSCFDLDSLSGIPLICQAQNLRGARHAIDSGVDAIRSAGNILDDMVAEAETVLKKRYQLIN